MDRIGDQIRIAVPLMPAAGARKPSGVSDRPLRRDGTLGTLPPCWRRLSAC